MIKAINSTALMAVGATCLGASFTAPGGLSLPASGDPIHGVADLRLPRKAQPRLGERFPLQPPFCEIFDDFPRGSEHDEFDLRFQVIDADNDGRSWGMYNYSDDEYSKCAYLLFPINVTQSDDWLVPRAMKLEGGKYYRVSMDASLFSSGGRHRFEVMAGEYNDPEGLNVPVIGVTEVTGRPPFTVSGWYVPEYDGIHYIGIHAISLASQVNNGYLFIDNIKVDAARTGAEPGAVTGLTFTNDPDGSADVLISFTAPVTAIDGSTLSGIVTVTVERDDRKVATLTNVTPGQAVELTDDKAQEGMHVYRVTTSSAVGTGDIVTVNHSAGISSPLAPTNIKVSENTDGTIGLSWEAPAADINGNPINPDRITYDIYEISGSESVPVELDVAGTSYTHDPQLAEGLQEVYMYAVSAWINGHESERSTSGYVFAGTPYGLPFAYSFVESGASDFVLGAEGDANVTWRFLDDYSDPKAQDCDNGYICMIGNAVGQKSRLSTGKIDLRRSESPYVSLYTYKYADDENIVRIGVYDYTTDQTEWVSETDLAQIATPAWNQITCPLSDFAGHIVRVVIEGEIVNMGYLPIDNLVVDEMPAIDLGAGPVEASRYAAPGETFSVSVTVTNHGSRRVDSFTARLVSNGVTMATTRGGSLESFASCTVTINASFNAASEAMPEFTVVVDAEGDSNPDNDASSPFSIACVIPAHPAPLAFTATETGAGAGASVALAWDAPDMSNAPAAATHEDFEDYESFATVLQGFTMYDGDRAYVAGLNGIELPVAGTQQAWWTVRSEGDFYFMPTYGQCSLSQMTSVDSNGRPVANDDWLISPRLWSGRQSISFMASAVTLNYGYETFEVWYSTSGNNVGDFKRLMGSVEVPDEWTQYFVTLPEGTTYFAVRCTSDDRYMLMLDEFDFIAEGEPLPYTLLGYNVYRNDRLLNTDGPVTSTTFATTRELDTDTYFVTAVYDRGESAASAVVRLGNTVIDAVGSDNDTDWHDAESFDMLGRRAPAAKAPGVYIERSGSSTRKVIIR